MIKFEDVIKFEEKYVEKSNQLSELKKQKDALEKAYVKFTVK